MVLAVCPSTLCTMTTKESTLERVPEALPGQPVPAYSSPQSLRQATVDIIIPVYNEEHSLPRCVDQLAAFISTEMPVPTSVIIADNASTDDTWEVAGTLCAQYDNVHRIHLDEKGRGRALKRAWLASNATVVAYMDVDYPPTSTACFRSWPHCSPGIPTLPLAPALRVPPVWSAGRSGNSFPAPTTSC